jgi:anthranilate synthase component 2
LQLDEVVHGKTKEISLTEIHSEIFNGIPARFNAGLYHSWIADPVAIPHTLEITAISPEKRIMALKHKYHDIEAVQFHPESIMTPLGTTIISNWINMRR